MGMPGRAHVCSVYSTRRCGLLMNFRLSLFSDINITQGGVATLVKCGGIFNANFIANFLTSQAVIIGQHLTKLS